MMYTDALSGPLDVLGAGEVVDAAFQRFVDSEAASRVRMQVALALTVQTLVVVGAVAYLTRKSRELRSRASGTRRACR